MKIDLSSNLTFKNAFLFPVQNSESRRELMIGAALLLIPFVGWILNMGHRIAFVHKMQHQRHPWPSWQNYRDLLKNGGITFVGMIFYYLPGSVLVFAGLYSDSLLLILAGGLLIGLATIAIPGFMSHYCKEFDPSEIFNPFIALKRVFQGGRMYWKAWCIALTALALSFIGLLFFGIGFLLTSVWFWQTAGYSFANVFSNRFELTD